MERYQAIPVGNVRAMLGEGPAWCDAGQYLLWVDIMGKRLIRYAPSTGESITYDMPSYIGTVVPTRNPDVAVVALQDGIYAYDMAERSIHHLIDMERDIPTNRANDGKCDPKGRLFVGTMGLAPTEPGGAFYRYDGDLTCVRDEVYISNGLAFDVDKRCMYYIDTLRQNVYRYDYDIDTGNVSNPVVAFEIPASEGRPDGCTIDEEGMLWIAQWGFNCVQRYNPQTGDVLAIIDVPTANSSSCCFAEDMSVMYITAAQPNSGEPLAYDSLFRVELPVKGAPSYPFHI